MKLLVITAGLTPLRGRANSYQESLIEALTARGHTVSGLLAALIDSRRHPHTATESAPWDSGARLHKVFNAGVYPALYSQGGVGTRAPRKDIEPTPWLRAALLEIIRREQPEAISYQSIFGLPFDLIREVNGLGIRTVFTMHDYFALCPTAHLFRPDHTRCRRFAAELDCANCCRESLGYGFFRSSAKLNSLAENAAQGSWRQQSLYRARNLVKRAGLLANKLPADAVGYRLRREAAKKMLGSFTVLHCISATQRELVSRLAGALPNTEVLPLIPPSINRVVPPRHPDRSKKRPIRFVALNIHGGAKGGELLSAQFAKLEAAGADYLLEVHGPSQVKFFASPRVTLMGRYAMGDLDEIAERSDYCVMPSVWDETLGFTGMEMLARGVPLITSSFCGASQFVQHGVNGYVFDPDEPDSLVSILQQICQPVVEEMVLPDDYEVREGLKPYADHILDMEALLRC